MRPIISWQEKVAGELSALMPEREACQFALKLSQSVFLKQFCIPEQHHQLDARASQLLSLLALANHHFVWGNAKGVFEALAALKKIHNISIQQKKDDGSPLPSLSILKASWFLDEVMFLKLAARRLTSGGAAFEREFQRRKLATRKSDSEYAERIEVKLGLEFACSQLNQGQCFAAAQLLGQVLGSDEYLDLCTEKNALAATVINLVNMGQQKKAKQRLSELASLNSQQGSARQSDFACAQFRYVSLICTEGSRIFPNKLLHHRLNKKLKNRELLNGHTQESAALSEATPMSKYDALCEQSLVRSYLRSGFILQAERAMRTVERKLQSLQLAFDFLNFAEERFELAVIQKDLSEVLIDNGLSEVRASMRRGDKRSEMRIRTLLGAAFTRRGRFSEAQKQLDIAVQIGASQGLKGDLLDSYFHMAGLFFKQKLKAKALGFLDLCVHVSRETDVPALESILLYVRHVYENRNLDPQLLCRFLELGRAGFSDFYLEHYDFFSDLRFSVGLKGSFQMIPEKSLREMTFEKPGVYFFEGQASVFLCSAALNHTILSLPSVKDFEAVVFALFENKRPCSVEDMHRLRQPSSRHFDSFRHSPAIRSFISRLRFDLLGSSVSLVFDPISRAYALKSKLPIVVIRSHVLKKHQHDTRRSNRVGFILDFAREREQFRVAELCRELRVTRQALHPVLRQLVTDGRLVLFKKGVESFYRLTPQEL